jgi:hypothetical protein
MTSEEAANEAIQHLRGSCEALYVEYAEWEEDEVFLGIIDDAIFNCTQCGWWHDISELNDNTGDFMCTECSPEGEE